MFDRISERASPDLSRLSPTRQQDPSVPEDIQQVQRCRAFEDSSEFAVQSNGTQRSSAPDSTGGEPNLGAVR